MSHRARWPRGVRAPQGRTDRSSEVTLCYRDSKGLEHRSALTEAAGAEVEDCAPVRRFPAHRRQPNLPGFYWFATTGRHVPYESRLEMAVLMELDFELDVEAVTAQPLRFECSRRGKVTRHVPDFFALLRSGVRRVVDVKPVSHVHEPPTRRYSSGRVPRAACREAGWD